jgi:hypothetical protein
MRMRMHKDQRNRIMWHSAGMRFPLVLIKLTYVPSLFV